MDLCQEQGDRAGYDIFSFEGFGSSRCIEVKTTNNCSDSPFYMSQNKKLYFDIYKNDNNLFFYRVYDFDIIKKGKNYTRCGSGK
ncbi:protein NO VEIN domain-containing protein [Lactobacillus sp. wkB8]|uniref:protein NO VEIN domain-containing protein n=1 Tax=Lactobacillus sp. wkB8 TaxID=1545702 RepID=UPI003526E451